MLIVESFVPTELFELNCTILRNDNARVKTKYEM